MNDKIKKQIEEEALRRFTKSGGKKSFSSVNRSIFTSACYWYHENLSTEQLVNALKSVEIYLRNQDLSEIGKQVQGKVLEALSSASNESRKESVNEKLLMAIKRRNDCALSSEQKEAMFKEAELFASNQENNEGWISVEDRLPKHLNQCVFLLNNGNVCIGKVKYFEHGDSELVDFMGKGINMYKRIYRNWEIKNFDGSKEFEVTHWMPLPKPPKEK